MTRRALELSIDPEDAGQIATVLGIARSGGASRSTPYRIVWRDAGDAALAAQGVVLAEHRQGAAAVARLERMRPDDEAHEWSPTAPSATLREAANVEALIADLEANAPDLILPPGLVAIAAFEGHARAQTFADGEGEAALTLMTGMLRAVAGERPVARLRIEGAEAAVASCATRLVSALRARAPQGCLAAEAYWVAGIALPAFPRAAPAPPSHLPPAEALNFVVARLTAAILHHAAGAAIPHHAADAASGADPEAVHQMRVAMRRMRSAFKLLAKVEERPELAETTAELKALGKLLGPPRDWDVFTRGALRDVLAAMPDDPALRQLAVAAKRERDDAYAALRAYLDSAAFRHLGLALCLLSMPGAAGAAAETVPDDAAEDGEAPEEAAPDPRPTLQSFAAWALEKSRKRLRAHGAAIHDLEPGALHAIRLDAKRLRYTAEFFAPLFPGKEPRRFVRRLAKLQEQLGLLNDGAATEALLTRIGSERRFAGGVVRGFVAAGSREAREKIGRVWRKFRRQDAFWT